MAEVNFFSRQNTGSKPRVALYVGAAVIALISAGVAGHGAFRSAQSVEAMLTVSSRPIQTAMTTVSDYPMSLQPALAKADRLVTVAKPNQPAVAVVVPSMAPAVRVEATLIPPKPQPRPCLEDCLMQSAAAPVDEADFVEPAEPVDETPEIVRPMPFAEQLAMAGVEGANGLVARGGHAVGSLWGWSGNAVGSVVQQVRSRTF